MEWIKLTPHTLLNVFPLFSPLPNDPLLNALLKGYHGELYADDIKNPRVAYGHIGWTWFIAGDTTHPLAIPLIHSMPRGTEILCDKTWQAFVIKETQNQATPKTRYAMNPRPINVTTLNHYINALPTPYIITAITHKHFQQILQDKWGEDFILNFKDYEDFTENGLGFVVLDGDKIVGGASSYARVPSGFDTEIITHEDYRRQGIARSIGAYFVKTCLSIGKIPHWDAAHLQSKRLAESLGYTLDYTFEVIEIL